MLTIKYIKYNRSEVKAKLAELSKTYFDLVAQIDDVSEWLLGEMEGWTSKNKVVIIRFHR